MTNRSTLEECDMAEMWGNQIFRGVCVLKYTIVKMN